MFLAGQIENDGIRAKITEEPTSATDVMQVDAPDPIVHFSDNSADYGKLGEEIEKMIVDIRKLNQQLVTTARKVKASDEFNSKVRLMAWLEPVGWQ